MNQKDREMEIGYCIGMIGACVLMLVMLIVAGTCNSRYTAQITSVEVRQEPRTDGIINKTHYTVPVWHIRAYSAAGNEWFDIEATQDEAERAKPGATVCVEDNNTIVAYTACEKMEAQP